MHKTMKSLKNVQEKEFHFICVRFSCKLPQLKDETDPFNLHFLFWEKEWMKFPPNPQSLGAHCWRDLFLSHLTQSTETAGMVKKSGTTKHNEKGQGFSAACMAVQDWEKVPNLETCPSGIRVRSGAGGRCQSVLFHPNLSHMESYKQSCCSWMKC